MEGPDRDKVVLGDGKIMFFYFMSPFCAFYSLIRLLLDNLAAGKEEIGTSSVQVNSHL